MSTGKIEIWAPALAVSPHTAASLGPVAAVSPLDSLSIPAAASAATPAFSPMLAAAAADGPSVFDRFMVSKVPLSDLTENLKQTLSSFQEIMDDLPKPASGYCIDEIELHFGVNGNGGIALIGKIDVGMEAAIKVKIKRTP